MRINTAQSTTEFNGQVESSVVIPGELTGQKCSISTKTTFCSYHADGSFPIAITGWVWFRYDKKLMYGHYDWAYLLEGNLSDDDRSIQQKIEVVAATNSNSESTALRPASATRSRAAPGRTRNTRR
ncbi:hypothetical protein BC936DRAFT_138787 [Jimgerdemannia flammicorona]|uniref:Uncharacterized protein n=1 Tax=Jimgerdemannia flammicorona TaxID=994334 RepID=A0A433BJ14_9FUNG|nr:hypothetical protein BC936DRAFT_138787 [Jimgerdemannia flammicorona]